MLFFCDHMVSWFGILEPPFVAAMLIGAANPLEAEQNQNWVIAEADTLYLGDTELR
jgi:hypothetical protein